MSANLCSDSGLCGFCGSCWSGGANDSTPSASPAAIIRSRSWASYSPSLPQAMSGATERLMTPTVEVQRKIVMLGFRAVGKTALSTQFAEGRFVDFYDPTIENTFRTTVMIRKVRFVCDILDTPGQDEYSSISRHASLGVHGYLLVYSSTSRASYEDVKMIHDKLLKAIGAESVPYVLVATKCDLARYREVPTEEGEALAAHWGCPFVECSAKENWGVENVFVTLLHHIEKDTGLLHKERIEKCTIL